MPKAKLRLVKNKSRLHKSSTVLFGGLIAFGSFVEAFLPLIPGLEPVLPPNIFPWMTFALGVIVTLGRYVKQEAIDDSNT